MQIKMSATEWLTWDKSQVKCCGLSGLPTLLMCFRIYSSLMWIGLHLLLSNVHLTVCMPLFSSMFNVEFVFNDGGVGSLGPLYTCASVSSYIVQNSRSLCIMCLGGVVIDGDGSED
jgi:hypothetical protein